MVFDDTDLSPNPIEQARRAAMGSYVDLTSSNPTDQGVFFPSSILNRAAAPYWKTRHYAPHSRGLLAARRAIVDYYATRTPPLRLAPDAVFLTASTSEAYSLLFSLLTTPGDNVLGPNITYPLFQYLAELHHIELRTYDLDPANGWQINQASLLAAADEHTRAILLISPHNPTGMIVQQPVPALRQLNLALICDEVFAPFTLGVAATPPLGALHPELPVFHLNGISKMLALPDMKLGWIALNSPALNTYAARLELINDTFLGCNALIQAMLPTLLAESGPFVHTMVSRVQRNVDYALARFAHCPRLTAQRPDGGYYLFPQVHDCPDDEALVVALINAGVLVYPGFFYDYSADCRIMISCLTTPEVFVQGVDRLINALNHV